jgi:hypothetical protein
MEIKIIAGGLYHLNLVHRHQKVPIAFGSMGRTSGLRMALPAATG